MKPASWSRAVLNASLRRRSGSLTSLRNLLEGIQFRVAEAESLGWPALADSWREDERRVRAAIEAHSRAHLLEAA